MHKLNNSIVRAIKTFMSEGTFKIPMIQLKKTRKLNLKSNRMKNFRTLMYHETDILPEKRTFKNIPKYANGKPKVDFKKWMLIKQEKGGHAHGKSEADGKWYGWSHRAVYGFGIGDRVEGKSIGKRVTYGKYTQVEIDAFKGDIKPIVGSTNYDKATYEKDFTIKTDDQAKEVAKRFADSVS